jgi:hypothetical protein
MVQPPTNGTSASPIRFSSGPMNRMGMRLMPEYSSEICPVISGVCSVSVWSSTHSYFVPN